MRILIVEDNIDSANMLRMALSHSPYTVEVAHTPPAAFEIAKNFNPEVIISDWNLGDPLTGVDVCTEIKSTHPDVITIFISGAPLQHVLKASAELSPFDVLSKPVNLDYLDSILETVTSGKAKELSELAA